MRQTLGVFSGIPESTLPPGTAILSVRVYAAPLSTHCHTAMLAWTGGKRRQLRDAQFKHQSNTGEQQQPVAAAQDLNPSFVRLLNQEGVGQAGLPSRLERREATDSLDLKMLLNWDKPVKADQHGKKGVNKDNGREGQLTAPKATSLQLRNSGHSLPAGSIGFRCLNGTSGQGGRSKHRQYSQDLAVLTGEWLPGHQSGVGGQAG
jgi:hypothetical protein